jgi:hypothetical protein
VTPDGYVGAVDVDADRVWATVAEPAGTPTSDDAVPDLMSLVVLDQTSGDVIDTLPVGPSSGEAHLVADEDAAWVVTGKPAGGTSSQPALHRASLTDDGDARDAGVAEVLVLDAGLTVQDVATWEDRVWISVTTGGDGSGPALGQILAIDAANGGRVPADDIMLPDGPVGPIEAGPDGLWFVDWRSTATGGERVVQVDPASGNVVAEVAINASALAVEQSWVWAWRSPGTGPGSGTDDEALVLIHRSTGRIVDEVRMPGDLTGRPHLAPAGDTIWYTHRGEVHGIDVHD